MSKSSKHNEWLPPQALKALSELGENLALARVRRRESLLDWAQCLSVSVRTVQRLETGDVGVGIGCVRRSPVAHQPHRCIGQLG